MSRARQKAGPVPQAEDFKLNTAQLSGISGVSDQLERTYALVSAAVDQIKGSEHAEDLINALVLLDMAEEELGTRECLNRIESGKYR